MDHQGTAINQIGAEHGGHATGRTTGSTRAGHVGDGGKSLRTEHRGQVDEAGIQAQHRLG